MRKLLKILNWEQLTFCVSMSVEMYANEGIACAKLIVCC